MSDYVMIRILNEVHFRIQCEIDIAYSLQDHFSFYPENYQRMPDFIDGNWDGKIRLFNPMVPKLYRGLYPQFKKFCEDRNIKILVQAGDNFVPEPLVTRDEIVELYKSFKLDFEPHDFQIDATVIALNDRRATMELPTSSGKSLLLYALIRYLKDEKIILTVHRINLVRQLYKEFGGYAKNDPSFNATEQCQMITGGESKEITKRIVISTYQSIHELPKPWFTQFLVYLGDEAHRYKAKCLTKISDNLVNAKFRIGVSGSLKDTTANNLVLGGIFGPIQTIVSSQDLMQRQIISSVKINAIILKYGPIDRRHVPKQYRGQMEYITNLPKRNDLISEIACSKSMNSLVIFNEIDHGQELYRLIQIRAGENRKVYYIDGSISMDRREEIKERLEIEKDSILIASYGVFTEGENIKNLYYLIMASPCKAEERVIQIIGRIMRKGSATSEVRVDDIVDDFGTKSKKNYMISQFQNRCAVYDKKGYPYKFHQMSF
jgi:superfamily II DNA or RNA helicase